LKKLVLKIQNSVVFFSQMGACVACPRNPSKNYKPPAVNYERNYGNQPHSQPLKNSSASISTPGTYGYPLPNGTHVGNYGGGSKKLRPPPQYVQSSQGVYNSTGAPESTYPSAHNPVSSIYGQSQVGPQSGHMSTSQNMSMSAQSLPTKQQGDNSGQMNLPNIQVPTQPYFLPMSQPSALPTLQLPHSYVPPVQNAYVPTDQNSYVQLNQNSYNPSVHNSFPTPAQSSYVPSYSNELGYGMKYPQTVYQAPAILPQVPQQTLENGIMPSLPTYQVEPMSMPAIGLTWSNLQPTKQSRYEEPPLALRSPPSAWKPTIA